MIYYRLKSYEKKIMIQKENKERVTNYYRELAAQGEVILNNDIYFGKGIKEKIVDWKNKIDEKIQRKESIDWKEQFDDLQKQVTGISKGLGVLAETINTGVNAVIIFSMIYWLYSCC